MAAAVPVLGTVDASERLITDLFISLRRRVNEWAAVTQQTAQARMGYIGQHLVSVATGFPGGKSGARGKDLVLPNGLFSEIKTCYRVDQLGKCLDCGAGVAAVETSCTSCGSENLKRNDDSKWLIGFQNEQEFAEVLEPYRYYLVLFDFVDISNPKDIQARIYEVDPESPGFALCMVDYYVNIRSKSKSKAPFNLWPYSPKFELMRPALIYSSVIRSDDKIDTLIFPGRDKPLLMELSPLADFARAKTLHETAITMLEERVPKNQQVFRSKKSDRLAAVDVALRTSHSRDSFIDLIAFAVYLPLLGGALKQLPNALAKRVDRIVEKAP